MAELKKLGRYELRRVLGKGAMGVVYEGFDPALGRLVAVKTILRSAALDDETERSYAARFALEAKAVARLNHPNIIQVYDFGVENDVAYLVMEFIQGRELRSYFDANQKFDQLETVRVMGELLDALEFAHQAGVIHRDVKPANVMLDAQRRVKLADFGVARIQDSDKSAAGTMVGTPAFMSPEQIQGLKIDRRTDIFSAGVVLYQLLTGEQPFKGSGAWTVAKKIMQDDPPQPSSLVSNISPAFDAIVDRALAKTPAERFANAREFAAALRGALADEKILQTPATPAIARQNAKSNLRASDTEIEFWRSIQNSSVPAEFEAYLQQYPRGAYTGLARVKLDTMRGPGGAEILPPVRAVDDATVAIPNPTPAGPVGEKRSFLAPVVVGALLLAGGVAALIAINREPAPVPVVAAPAPVATKTAPPPVPVVDETKIRRDVEDRIRREYADKSAAEQAAVAKVATEKAIQEKQAAAKAAADRIAAEKAAADKLAAEKQLAEKLAAAKSAAERASLEKAAAEKAVLEKSAADKVAAEKLAAEKAAAERVAAEKTAAEKVAAAKVATPTDELLAKFVARHGSDRVLDSEPVNYLGAMRRGEIIYVNDGSCAAGSIREVTGGDFAYGGIARIPRTYRCISLKD